MTTASAPAIPLPWEGPAADAQQRLEIVVEMMREMSRQTDPQAMVRAYTRRMRSILPADGSLSLSRRGLEYPRYRITRSSRWKEDINPWKQLDKLPVLEGGLLAELIYSDEPKIIDDLNLAPDDPAVEYLESHRSLMAIPNYDEGRALNMVILLRKPPAAFSPESFPELVWMANLFGRATHNLVLSEKVREAYELIDHELRMVATLQRSLLPRVLPRIPTMDLAVYYRTAQRAGGDYYDFLERPDGTWGILIADVSGHGTPAAVLMAVTHALVHSVEEKLAPPGELLATLNRHLTTRYTGERGSFVTAFFGVYDPVRRTLCYANAGHHTPRLKRCADGSLFSINGVRHLPLGIAEDEIYPESTIQLEPGDQMVLYTDGITEARNASGEMFGNARLDAALRGCRTDADELIANVLGRVNAFSAGHAPDDDQTMVVAKIL